MQAIACINRWFCIWITYMIYIFAYKWEYQIPASQGRSYGNCEDFKSISYDVVCDNG